MKTLSDALCAKASILLRKYAATPAGNTRGVNDRRMAQIIARKIEKKTYNNKARRIMKPSQRYYLHRKIREAGYRVDARKRTVYVPGSTPPRNDVVKYFEKLGYANYNFQIEIE